MTSPQPSTPPSSPEGAGPAVACSRLQTIKKRPDFLRAATARRFAATGFLLQARQRQPDEAGMGARVGFTCTKKVGNAVTRNRAKRRLRALAHEILTAQAKPGWDYVLVGRPGVTVSRSYADLIADMHHALSVVHAPRRPK